MTEPAPPKSKQKRRRFGPRPGDGPKSWEKPAKPHERRADGKPKRNASGPPIDKARLQDVLELKELLFPKLEIVRLISEKYGVSASAVYEDINRIDASWQEEAALQSPEKHRLQAKRTAAKMFRRSVAKGDDKTARKFFEDWCKITGSYAPDAMKLYLMDKAKVEAMSQSELDGEIAKDLKEALLGLPPAERAALLAQVVEIG